MKTFKMMICVLFVLCGGLVFAACGKTEVIPKDFDVNKIYVSAYNEFTYDGNSHAVDVSYYGVDVNVSYAFESDRENFKPLNELQAINAGNYKVYYRISAEGYNSYTSEETIKFKINPRTVEIYMENYDWIKSNPQNNLVVGYTSIGIVNGDDLGISFSFGSDFDAQNAKYNEEYNIYCSITNPNYKLAKNSAKLVVKDYFHLVDNDGQVIKDANEKTIYYPNIKDAIDNAQSGDTIVLNDKVMVKETIVVDKDITIDGQGKFQIVAESIFKNGTYGTSEVATIFMLNDSSAKLTLKDVTLNGSQTVRGVSAFEGALTIDGSTITNGKRTDEFYSGGVYVNANASFDMNSGKVWGNNANETSYTKYGADLWLESNNCSIDGGTVDKVFVQSTAELSQLVINGGNLIDIYVEYSNGYGAKVIYNDGTINNVYVSLVNGEIKGIYREFKINQQMKGTAFVGGKIVYNKINNNTSFTDIMFSDNIDETSLITNGNYIFENCTFNAPIIITKKVGLIFNNCTFTTSETATNLYLTSVTNLVVNNCTFNGTTTGGYAIDVNLYSTTKDNLVCENILISNNIFNTTSTDENGSISIKTRLGSTDHPTEDWAKNAKPASIEGVVKILGNYFTEKNNLISVGEVPQGMDTTANTTTGDFDVFVDDNLDSVTIYNKFKDSKHVTEENMSKITIQEKGLYDSTQE